MTYKATNFAKSTLAAGISAAATTLQIAAADIPLFPVVNDGGTGTDYTMLTLLDAAGNKEVVQVDRHDTAAATFTVVRAREGTTARIWALGDAVSLQLTAGVVTQTYTHPGASSGAHAATAISYAGSANLASTTVEAALDELDSEKASLAQADVAANTVDADAVTPIDGNIMPIIVGGVLKHSTWENIKEATKSTLKTYFDTLYQAVGSYQALDAQLSSLVRQNSQNAGYACVLTDSGKHIYMATAGVFTIPANASVAYPIGTAITFVNLSAASTIAINTDTMYWAGPGTTGTRTLAQYGMVTVLKIGATSWIISGAGLS